MNQLEHTIHSVQHGPKSPTEGLLACFTAFLSPLVGVLVFVVVGDGSSGKAVWAVEPKKAAVEGICLQTSPYARFARIPSLSRASVRPSRGLTTDCPYYMWRSWDLEICLFSLTQASHYISTRLGGLE